MGPSPTGNQPLWGTRETAGATFCHIADGRALYQLLRVNFVRQPVQYFRENLARDRQRLLSLMRRGFFGSTWITELPGIPSEWDCPVQDRTQGDVDLQTVATELPQVVSLSKRPLVEGEETFNGFFRSLLAVEDNILPDWRDCGKAGVRAAQVNSLPFRSQAGVVFTD